MAGEDDAEVGLAVRQPLFVQKCIVPDIEAVEHSSRGGRMAQMIFVAPVDHRVIGSQGVLDLDGIGMVVGERGVDLS